MFAFLTNVNNDSYGTFLGIDRTDEISGQTVSSGTVLRLVDGTVYLTNDCRHCVTDSNDRIQGLVEAKGVAGLAGSAGLAEEKGVVGLAGSTGLTASAFAVVLPLANIRSNTFSTIIRRISTINTTAMPIPEN